MIAEPRWMNHPAIKPGHGEPEPIKPVRTRDTPENIVTCLNCPVPEECRRELSICPLRGGSRKKKLRSWIIRSAT